ncbi:MAG: protein translocase subunit SecF [Termitinemataceae bacterium]|nr:MAG: protein translocase subunit SecF [Termitinemataceae bacterium]
MKRIIPFSKAFLPAAILSVALIAFGLTGYFVNGGFSLGVDFKAGRIQEVRFAPTAFGITYNGIGNALISFNRSGLDITISDPSIDNIDHKFLYAGYPTLQTLTYALESSVEGISVELNADGTVKSEYLLQSAHGNPQLGSTPFVVHYMEPNALPIEIAQVRSSLEKLGDVAVQVLGTPQDRHFMIRMDEKSDNAVSSDQIINALADTFGREQVVITRSDFVDSRFSKQLSDQAGILMVLTLLLILLYASIRFKTQYAIGAVLAISHDALIMVGFIVWTRMEFNTTTIAAILTILGYSINDTIVVFDRIRETRRLYPDDTFINVINRAVTETLGRTIITTLTTMLAVVSLYIFTTGSMKDFALALLVGMVSGVYSTIFIANAFATLWEYKIKPHLKPKRVANIVSV